MLRISNEKLDFGINCCRFKLRYHTQFSKFNFILGLTLKGFWKSTLYTPCSTQYLLLFSLLVVNQIPTGNVFKIRRHERAQEEENEALASSVFDLSRHHMDFLRLTSASCGKLFLMANCGSFSNGDLYVYPQISVCQLGHYGGVGTQRRKTLRKSGKRRLSGVNSLVVSSWQRH